MFFSEKCGTAPIAWSARPSLVTVTSLISQGITDNRSYFICSRQRRTALPVLRLPKSLPTSVFMPVGRKHGRRSIWQKTYGRKMPLVEDAKAAFQREMIFPVGEPNTAYAKYFTGNSYLAPHFARAGEYIQCYVRTSLPQ